MPLGSFQTEKLAGKRACEINQQGRWEPACSGRKTGEWGVQGDGKMRLEGEQSTEKGTKAIPENVLPSRAIWKFP